MVSSSVKEMLSVTFTFTPKICRMAKFAAAADAVIMLLSIKLVFHRLKVETSAMKGFEKRQRENETTLKKS